jgi:hypothetical protein
MTDKNLIIIASQPRSGSTLLQALLSNNDTVGTVSEPWLLLPFLSTARTDLIRSGFNSEFANIGLNDFQSKIGTKGFKEDLSQFLLSQYSKILKNDENYILDKTPRYYEILDEIIEYFPNAKIIILKRNPIAVLYSIIKTWNTNSLKSLLEYKRDLLEAPFLLHKFSEKQVHNKNVRTVHYEAIVNNPLVEIKKLYNWLDIPFKPERLNYGDNKKYKGLLGDPTGVKSHNLPNKDSLYKWKAIYNNKEWNSLANGYAQYLKKDFLDAYGNYKDIKYQETKLFNRYLEMSKWDFDEVKIPKLKLFKNAVLRRLGIIKD